MTPIIALTLLIGLYVGHRLQYWLTDLVDNFEKKRILTLLTPTAIIDYRLCDRHVWINAKSLDSKGEFVNINVCGKCGFFPSLNSMATLEGLKRIKENNKIYEFDDKIKQEFITLEEAGIREYFVEELNNGLNFDKLVQLYDSGRTLKQRFILYKITRAEQELKSDKEVTYE